jgi:hypothetical protein
VCRKAELKRRKERNMGGRRRCRQEKEKVKMR